MFYIDERNPHLGGFIRGGDEATWYPALWKWLVDDYGVRSVIDVGCGEGHAIRAFRDLGCRVLGVDGIEQADSDIYRFDFTIGEFPDFGDYDLCWCCEFVEHVEPQYIPNYLAAFQSVETVLMTHAFPGQPGHHHVNLREPEYWKGVMAGIGYEFDSELTAVTRELAAENKNPYNHFVRSGLAFRCYE